MKLTIYLFLFSLFNIHASTYSQKAKVTLDLNNVSVEKVFREIESQTEFKVLYNDNDLNYKKLVSIKVRNELVTNVLKNLFNNTNIHYKTVGKQIVMLKSNAKKTIAQQVIVKGNVKDDLGMPIPGANVVVKGTTNGTITDFDGNYSITVKNNNAVLVFSYVGYLTKEVSVNGKTVVDVVLEADVSELDAVVLVGYGTVKKSDLTGSVSSVNTEQISKTQNVSIAQAIQGRAAGVTVSKSSGSPGAAPTVRIRGTGTVNNANPLYVVDGVPVNDITNINMEDAKSIEVLKDASATAIYGSRGANGVILIETKKGTKNKPTITYNTYTGFQNKIDNLEVMNAQQWAEIRNEANTNDGTPLDPEFSDPASLPSYNWKDAVYQTGVMTNHQLSFSGGSDKSTYYVSLGHISQKGIVKESSYKRTNLRINNTYQLNKAIKVGHNIQYAFSDRVSIPEYGPNVWTRASFVGFAVDPVTPIYKEDGSLNATSYSSAISPLGLAKYGQRPNKRENFLGNLFLELDVFKGLKFRSNFGLDITNVKVDYYIPAYYVSPTYNSDVSTYNLNRSENRSMVLSNTLNYNTTIAKKHSINALLGQEIQELENNNVNTQRSGIPESVAKPTLGSGSISTSTNSGDISKSKLLSFFGRLNYNYDDRYLITGTYRLDGSSRFGANNKWGKFPSLALGWNIHKENFYDIEAINQLKFRLGWGETGNQNIPTTAIANTLNLGSNYVFGNEESTQVGVAPFRSGNADLKWETTVTKNIGVDVGLLENSITLTADYFIKNTTDLLLAVPVLQTSGNQQNGFANAGNIENKGLELTANYKKTINDFSFSVGGNIAFIKNKVLKLANDGILTSGQQAKDFNRTEVGQPIASFYGYEMIGIFQNQDEVDNSAILPNTQPGDVKYRDLNEDGVIDDDDRKYIGSPFADFTYGLNLDMSYKQFDFSAFFQGSQGNKIFNRSIYWLEGDLGSNLSTNMLNRWTGEGTSNSVPRATFKNVGVNMPLSSSRYVQDGSYLRLKNIELGYTIPKDLTEKIAVSKLRLYVAAQNLITFTQYNGLDPEVGVDAASNDPLDIGIDRGRYPSTRTISVGANINF
ncbi:TonB-linked SusC/RagA family outer membrane protein [Wenyingzhuangia heitensis]|uniref:TonB-linked SusC/RagA family outer membrane protein n=1 Tax=Wenyingzhuangia heitensis TaxID=1487859 RepID=A0ABX0U821_9FLAO|nr:TonB-dependent receptor [Wenyingzhuangia heitensis]NIJ43900.1 TonB-linked SusC/RagA family outer membrane protein [Wenyingzhuangia heitensis]